MGDVRDTTEGFFSRWVVVPFSAFYPAGRADVRLIDRLTSPANLQGLLRMAVGGLQQVLRRGAFAMPPSVAGATDKFKRDSDPMRGFIDERIEPRHPSNAPFVPRTELYNAYTIWSALNGFHQMSAQRFYESFMAACIDTVQQPIRTVMHHGINGFRGIALR